MKYKDLSKLFTKITKNNSIINNYNSNQQSSSNECKSKFLCSYRFLLVLLIMYIFFSITSARMNLSMAITCMVNSSLVKQTIPKQELLKNCPSIDEQIEDEYKGKFNWDQNMQSQLFSATFYGSLITVWIAGYLTDRFGPKYFLAFTLINSTLITFLMPFLAETNYTLFFISRIFMGIGEGFVYPATSTIASNWFPPNERSQSAAIYTTGNQLAFVISFLVSSQLCKLTFLGGWPLIFYSFGFVTLTALILLFIFISNKPSENRWISQNEKDYIFKLINLQFNDKSLKIKNNNGENNKILNKTLWRFILTSPTIYAILFAQFTFSFTSIILQSYLPTYSKNILHLNLNQNGKTSVIPFFVQLLLKNFYGWLSDKLKQKKFLTNTNAAKMFQTIGNIGIATIFLILNFYGNCENILLVRIIFCLYGIFFSCGICGFFTSMLSIAPNYTGLITSISTTFSILASLSGPQLVSFFIINQTQSEWGTIFNIIAGINILSAILFLLFGSAEIQKWALMNE